MHFLCGICHIILLQESASISLRKGCKAAKTSVKRTLNSNDILIVLIARQPFNLLRGSWVSLHKQKKFEVSDHRYQFQICAIKKRKKEPELLVQKDTLGLKYFNNCSHTSHTSTRGTQVFFQKPLCDLLLRVSNCCRVVLRNISCIRSRIVIRVDLDFLVFM